MREDFEKAMTANVVMPRPHLVPHLHTMFNRFPSGEYVQLWVDSAWTGWQAATALQAERVRELEEALQWVLADYEGICAVELKPAANWKLRLAKAHKALSATAREDQSCKS